MKRYNFRVLTEEGNEYYCLFAESEESAWKEFDELYKDQTTWDEVEMFEFTTQPTE